MQEVGFFTPVYYHNPQNIKESFVNFVEGHFDFSGEYAQIIDAKQDIAVLQNHPVSWVRTAAKIIVWIVTLGTFPAIVFILKVGHRLLVGYHLFVPPPLPLVSDRLQTVVENAPPFKGYRIGTGTLYEGASLTSLSVRPSNLFYNALFQRADAVTLPGSGKLFAFQFQHGAIRNYIAAKPPHFVVPVHARGVPGTIHSQTIGTHYISNLAEIYGDAIYHISYGEIQQTLQSQKIYTAPLLPLQFYSALKRAMAQDGIVTLPEHNPKIGELNHGYCGQLIEQIRHDFAAGGFKSEAERDALFDLTLYHLGCLVVKSEDFRVFIDSDGKMLARMPGENDAVRLINACGIRPNFRSVQSSIDDRTLLTQMYSSSLIAAESGFLVVPAVGMGVWRGNPDLYWRAFLDSVAKNGSHLEQIFVNPNHQTTRSGVYAGYNGQEFKDLLNFYLALYANDSEATENLRKIVNLAERQTDVVQFSRLLKKEFPEKTVSLLNASDPDVTLGFHVGEYVNNLDHATTTEENYTALGTNGLCFETITGVHNDPLRLIDLK